MKAWPVIAGVGLLLLVSCKRQEPEAVVAPPPKKDKAEMEKDIDFASQFVIAVNTDDEEKLRSLIHSKSLACMSENNREYYEEMFSRYLAPVIPEAVQVGFEPIPDDEPLAYEELFDYPLRPTHNFVIEFGEEDKSTPRIINQVVFEEDKWLLVIPCPTAQALTKFREFQANAQARKANIQSLVAQLQDPLLGELKEMLKQGRRADAAARLSEASKAPLDVAFEAITLIEAAEE